MVRRNRELLLPMGEKYCYKVPNPILASIYLFKVKSGNTRIMCEICSKLTLKTPEHVFIVNFEKKFTYCSAVSFADFGQVNASWGNSHKLINPLNFKKPTFLAHCII